MSTSANTGVKFVREEVRKYLSQYDAIEDCLAGEQAVKAKGETYLPNPSSLYDDPAEKRSRYAAYKLRAVFYNLTRRTMQGLCGQAFSKPPSKVVPTQLEPVTKSIGGDGVTLEQQAKAATEATLACSRAGLLVDFPNTGGKGASRKDIETSAVRPTVTLYEARRIINWRSVDIAAEQVITLLVLSEIHQVQDPNDSFVLIDQEWFRVYYLTNLGVTVEIWVPNVDQKTSSVTGYQLQGPAVTIEGGDGKPLQRIPFFVIGLSANSWQLEPPAFYDIASLNLAHYRNSADYEEMLFITGQPTPVLSGLTTEWYENVLQKRINFGSRGGIPLNTGATAELLQAEAQDALLNALQHKEAQAVALGAKLVEQKQVQRTATEAKIENTAEGSVLESVANNVSSAYLQALQLCCQFLQVAFTDETLQFQINTDFDLTKLTTADLAAVEKSTMLSWNEKRRAARAVGLAVDDDDEVKAELEKDKDNEMAREIALAGAGNDPLES